MTAPSEERFDILITDASVLTMTDEPSFIAQADIGIRNGLIVSIRNRERRNESAPPDQAREVIPARGQLVMPGLVNTHTHLPMVLLRGLADDLPLMEWLNGFIFPAEGRFMNEKTVYAASLLAMAEMILSGTTTFCDSYFFVDRIAQAAMDTGMRGVVCQGFIDFSAPDAADSRKKARLAEQFLSRWQNSHPLIKPALFCHSPYTCSSETLKEIKRVSRDRQVPYLIHLAETKDEVNMIQEKYRKTPAFYLDDLGVLDADTIAVHCNWLTDDEIDLLSRRRVKISHCPESNMKLGAGMAPIPKLLRHGITVGLGTDGTASNNNLDLFREMSMAARIHKVIESDPTVMNAGTVLRMATIDGARLLGLDRQIGTVEVGKAADLILIDLNQPHMTPLYHGLSQMVYTASGSDVVTVIIDGKLILHNRRFVHINLADIMKTVRNMGDIISRELSA